MPVKAFPALIKTDTGSSSAGAGEFEAIVSVFGNIDSYGDVVRPGAFAETLADWAASGDPIPVYWSHRMDDPRFNIGLIRQAAELPGDSARIPDWAPEPVKVGGGLWVTGSIDTGPGASDIAAATARLLAARRVKQFSFAYDILDAGWGEADGDDAYELRKLRIHEVSVAPVGANPSTVLLDAKNPAQARLGLAVASAAGLIRDLVAQAKAGRVLSAANEATIRDAVQLLNGVLAAIDDGSAEKAAAKAEEPEGVKAQELPNEPSTDRVLRELDLAMAEVATL